MKIISGEKIQQACDYYIGSEEDINWNPLIRKEIDSNPTKFINIDKTFDSFDNLSNIFCYTHILTNKFQNLISILNKMNNDFEIYFHNSDVNFLQCHYQELSKIKKIKKIYSQNNTVREVITLPIGQANSMWTHGNHDLLFNIANKNNIKIHTIYFNFNITTNTSERQKCKTSLSHIPWINNLNYHDYLETLSLYKFCICPVGNGLDTHRFWECIYLKVIPICVKNEWTETIKDKVQLIVLNEWSDLNYEDLKYQWHEQ